MISLDNVTESELDELSGALPYDLELFDVLRQPRFVTNDDYTQETTLKSSGLREEITCAICCSIIQRCVVIKACLHRFCADCISKAMRIGGNECPKSRTHFASKRFLVPDSVYDKIVATIIPNIKAFEEMCDAFIMACNRGLEKDPKIETIRQTLMANESEWTLENVSSLTNGLVNDGFSVTSAFDRNQYIKEITVKRCQIFDAMPPSPGVLRTCYQLVSEDPKIPQIKPNVLFEDGSITLHHLLMYVKRRIGLLPFSPLYFYTKDPPIIGKPTQTLAYIRNFVKLPSHLVLTVYYGSHIPQIKH